MGKSIENFREEYAKKHDLIGSDPKKITARLKELVYEADNIRIKELESVTGKSSELLYSFIDRQGLIDGPRRICVGAHLTSETSIGIILPFKSKCSEYVKDFGKEVAKAVTRENSREITLPYPLSLYTLEFVLSDNLRSSELSNFLLSNFSNKNVRLIGLQNERELDGRPRDGRGFCLEEKFSINSLEELTEKNIAENFNLNARLLIQVGNKYVQALDDSHILEIFESHKNFERKVETYNKHTLKIIDRIKENIYSISKISSEKYLGRFTRDIEEHFRNNKDLIIFENEKNIYALKPAEEYAEQINENAVRNIKSLIKGAGKMELRRNKAFIKMKNTEEEIKEYFSEEN